MKQRPSGFGGNSSEPNSSENSMAPPAARSVSSARRRVSPRSICLCLSGGARELLHYSNIYLDKCFPKSAPYCIIGREYENRACEAIIFSCLAAFLSTLLINLCTCKGEALSICLLLDSAMGGGKAL